MDSNTKLGALVIAIMSILSGLRLLIDHFASGTKIGEILGKIVDFGSGNVKH